MQSLHEPPVAVLGIHIRDIQHRDSGRRIFADRFSETGYDLPAGLTRIDSDAFAGTAIEEVTIPDSIRRIESCTFQRCFRLKRVHIPESVEYISWRAFDGCDQLRTVAIPGQKDNSRICLP